MDPSAEEEFCSIVSIVVGVSGNPAHYSMEEQENVECKFTTIGMSGVGGLAPELIKSAISQGM